MDIINHAAFGYVMPKLFKKTRNKVWLIILFVLMGVLPDVIGWIGLEINGDYAVYNIAHAWWIPLNLFPSYGLHVLLDSFTHGNPFYWWRGWGLVFEVTSWLVVIWLIYLSIKNKGISHK